MTSIRIGRRTVLAGTAALLAGGSFAQQGFPSKPIRLLVPFPPGGSTTVVARLLGQKLTERLGQPVIVDNKPGANGVIASEELLKSPADGHTILMVVNTHAINPVMMASLPYDNQRDFAPVTTIYRLELVLVAHPSVPANTLREFVAIARDKKDSVNFAAGDTAGLTHFAAETFNSQAGTRLQVVPYKGSGPAMSDLLGGHVQAYFSSATAVIPHVRAGKLKAFGISGPTRAAALPDLPTFAEAGMPDLDVGSWAGILASGKTPPELVNRLSTEISTILNLPDVKAQLAAQGLVPTLVPTDRFASLIKSDTARFEKIVQSANIKVVR